MKKRLRLALIVVCILVLAGIRFFAPEDTRICEGDTLVKHGHPSSSNSGLFCSGGYLITQSLLFSQPTLMKIITDFIDNGNLPSTYTCDGEGYFPKLTIEDIPSDTKSLILVVEDPDAPGGVWDHLLLANVPISESSGIILSQDSFELGILGQNSRGEQARGAPCPPSGTHRYIFKVYAISELLELSSGFSKERLLELMGGRTLTQAQIIGLYARQ